MSSQNKMLTVTTPIPPSVNHYMGYRAILKGGKPLAVPYKTPEAKAYQKEFTALLKHATQEQNWCVGDGAGAHYYVDAVFYFPRTRMDANNYWKVLLDTITDTKLIWEDDDTVCERVQAILYDKDNPRIELTIHPVEYIGVFENASQLEAFESNCILCSKYARNCSILRKAKEGRIQNEISGGSCANFSQSRSKN